MPCYWKKDSHYLLLWGEGNHPHMFLETLTKMSEYYRTKMRRKKFVPIPEAERPEDKIDTRSLTLDEIEEIRRKRERNKRERDDGEIDDEDDEDDRSKRKSKSKRDRSPSYR